MSKGGPNASRGFKKCAECGSIELTKYDDDIIVCADCGHVGGAVDAADTVTNTVGHNPNRNLDISRRKTNYMKTSAPCRGRLTTLDSQYYIDGDIGENNDLDGIPRNRLLKMWWKKAKVSNGTEKNLALAFSEITKIGDILSLPKMALKRAAYIYKMIVEKRYVRGRNIRTLSAASVYMACKQYGFPPTLNEVAIASETSGRDVGKSYRFLVKELGSFIPPVKPAQYLKKFLNHMTISEKTEEIIEKILEVADELKLTSGRDPMGIIAAATYVACLLTGQKRTQRQIAEATRITEATIRNRYKELVKHLLFRVSL